MARKPKVPPTRAPKKKASPKSSFKLRKLALLIVVDEIDASGVPINFDIELHSGFVPTAEKMIGLLKKDFPALISQLKEGRLPNAP